MQDPSMDISKFTESSPGRLAPTIANQRAFVPFPLPPELDISPIQQVLSEADQKLGELRGIGRYLPNPYLLIRPLQRKEAIASSNIEGTYTSLSELLLFESGVEDRPRATDTLEVLNYITAIQQGFELLESIPISNRLICALHKTLLSRLPRHRSGYMPPGEYRKDQNFIGKTKEIVKSRFNPPPHPVQLECMNQLERFINSEDMHNIPPLVFLALIHYQFETIHPFPDGNGRVGRILIPLILRSRGIMDQPLLYMSQYFEDNRDEYNDLMLVLSQTGDWAAWLRFFLTGVIVSCEKTIDTIHKVRNLQDSYKERCQKARSSALLVQIVDSMFEKLAITIPSVRDMTGTSYTAAQHNVRKLVEYGILQELDVGSRPKFFFAGDLLRIFEE
jgi:Fic family protein